MSSSCKASTKLISKRPSSLNMPTRLSPSRLPTISTRPSPISVPSKIIHDGDLKKKKLSHSPSWNVAEDVNSLPEVPFLHVPSTTYAIVGEENPRTVATRIADAVAALSSIGNYNDEKAIATINTIADVKLSINLFKHKGNSILIELQRLSGDVVQYHYTAKAILQAAKKNLTTSTPHQHFKPTVTVAPDRILSQSLSPLTGPTNQSNVFTRTMENIQNLLRKDRIDASTLGMESLQLLTDGSSSNEQIALEASKAVLFDGQWQDVKNIIFSLVSDGHTICESDEHAYEVSDELGAKLRLALSIIGNALNVVCQQKNRKHVTMDVDVDEMKDLMDSLTTFMKEEEEFSSNSNIQTVYHAARCLSYIIDLSPELRSAAADLGMIEVVRNNIAERATRHHLLQNVSDRIMLCLGGIKGEKN